MSLWRSITRIACQVFDVASAFITLVDQDRVWFKAMSGCDVREEPSDVSFCGHTVNNIVTHNPLSRLFEVHDVLQDDRFCDNSFIIDQCKVRSYLGFVITSSDDYNIGTFCITDPRPRTFNNVQKQLFCDMGAIAETMLRQSYTCTGDLPAKLLNVTSALESLQKQFNKSFKNHNINYREWRILNEIITSECATPSSLSHQLGLSSPVMTRTLDAMEAKRLVCRWYSKDDDRRYVHVTCSDKGKECWRKGLHHVSQFAEARLKDMIC